MIGSTVAHYRITERLGGGSMGVVYRAEDTRLKRTVALKFLPAEVSDDVNAKERFLREAQAASRLDHPNICTVHEIGETADGQLFIVMAFYRGETLKRRIARGTLEVSEVLDYAWQIARGLANAHAENVVHRDVKPANVLITDDGQVKLLDFGLAKVAGESALTRTGSSIGTPVYMSPEQIGGQSDERTDIWSLGVVLYEMLTGERPFRGSNSATTMYAILHRKPAPLAEVRAGLPPSLQPILDRALAKDLEHRYRAMAHFAEDLADAGSDEMTATQPMLVVPPARTAAGRWWLWAAAAGLVLSLAAALAWSPWASRPPAPPAATPAATVAAPRAVAVLPFTFRGSSELAYLREGMVDLLSTKLDGAGDLRSVDPRALLSHLAIAGEGDGEPLDPRRAAAIGRRFDADLFILGNIVEVSGQLRFDARLYRVAAAPVELAAATAEGTAGEIFTLVDRLAAQLLAAGQEDPQARISGLAAVTTESFAALKAYLEGESAYRGGRFEEAARSFASAVGEDPGFALAWYRLALVSEWLVDAERAADAAMEAERHSGRLAEHDRLLVEALAAYSRGDSAEAERLYRDIVQRHPDDVEAWAGLAETEFHYGPLDGRSRRRSHSSWQRVESLEPGDFNAQLHLARLDLYDRDLEGLAARATRLESLLQGTSRISEVLFFRANLPGGAAARQAIDREVRASSLSLGWMPASFFAGTSWYDPEVWLPTIGQLLEGERPARERTYAHRLLGVLHLALGRVEAGDRDLRQASAPSEAPEEYRALAATVPFLPLPRRRLEELRATALGWPRTPPEGAAVFSPIEPHAGMPGHLRAYVLGLIEARLGNLVAALALADELAGLGDPARAPGLQRDLAAGVRAEVARQQGDSNQVLARLGERQGRYSHQLAVFSPLHSQVRERWLRAEALYDLERLEEAYGWYESLAELNLFDLAYLAHSHLRRGQICERLGRSEEASYHYRRSIELWGDADAPLGRLLAAAKTGAVRSIR